MEKYVQKIGGTTPTLYEVEAELKSVSEGTFTDNDYHQARRVLVQYLSSLCNFLSDEKISLPDAIEQVARCTDNGKRRIAAIVLARVAGISGVLSVGNSSNQLNRKLVEIFEKNLPDISKKLFQNVGSQTFERFEAISGLNQSIVASFQIAGSLPEDVTLLVTNRTEVIKAISSELNSAYLNPFDQKHVKVSLNHIFTLLNNMLTTNDFSFATKLDELRVFLADEMIWCESYPTFFTREFYSIILGTVISAVTDFERNQAGRFSCDLSPKRKGAYSTPFGHPFQHDPATCSTMIWPGQSERSDARFSG